MKIRKTGQTGKSKSDSEWIYGLNPVIEALRSGRKIKKIFLSSNRRKKSSQIIKKAANSKIPLTISDPTFFDRNFCKGHQGIAAEVYPRSYWSLNELLEIPTIKKELALFLILDCIEDIRNFGAILRVADASGIHGIVIQSRRSVSLNPQVSKASAGAVEYVPVSIVPNIKHAINKMKERGIMILGANADSEQKVWDSNLTVPLALIIGSESKGLRRTIKSLCDVLVSIPMKGKINSLNVSVATGVIIFEIIRQRLRNN
ncbi:MAG TPA: 23S rRNA (guanosine(2251)-2'-O)-methyltransferase RlmB [Chromatiaceae bacterium]|nr:23S rRNA (guanosine(2251)-2'-O)-methyltransferase RlmB [Chromatiaceae bacterium]